MILSEAETPPNIIPADDFIAQSQSELYVADFLMEVGFNLILLNSILVGVVFTLCRFVGYN